MEKRFLDVKQCSKFLNISTHFIYKLVEQKQIPHTRLGKKVLFDIKKLEEFIEENSVQPTDWSEILNK